MEDYISCTMTWQVIHVPIVGLMIVGLLKVTWAIPLCWDRWWCCHGCCWPVIRAGILSLRIGGVYPVVRRHIIIGPVVMLAGREKMSPLSLLLVACRSSSAYAKQKDQHLESENTN